MHKRVIYLDILLEHRPSSSFAYLFGDPLVAALGETPDEAIERVKELVHGISRTRPWQFLGADTPPHTRPNRPKDALFRAIPLEIPVSDGRKLFFITLDILVATRPVATQREDSSSPASSTRKKLKAAQKPRKASSGQIEVFLPEIPLFFTISSLDQLELGVREYLCQHFGVEERLEALAGFLRPSRALLSKEVAPKEVESRKIASDEHRAQTPTRQLERRRVEVELTLPQQEEVEDEEEQVPTLEAVGEPLHRRLGDGQKGQHARAQYPKDSPRAFERRAEVGALLNFLADEWERSVLLVGPPGVGKTAIVHEAVRRMGQGKGKAPESLREASVWQISGGRLMAGMRFLGQWQERVLAVIAEAKRSGAILFADNLVELLEATGNEKYAQGIPGLLLPHILSGDLVLISEARPEQLAYIEQRQPSFLRALRRLPIEPLSTAKTDAVLERVSFRLGREHGVRLSAETRQRIIELSVRFPMAAALPGPAVDLAERMARTHRTRGLTAPGEPRPELEPAHAVEAFASQTGLPRMLLDSREPFDIGAIEQYFSDAIFDQPEAISAMVDLVAVIRAGVNPPQRPFGSYFFLGPTGVGKTQTALTLARYLFGSEKRLLRFDMSEFQDAWSAARLVGRYKGEQGVLVRRVREQPFQVILFDEIEKAHSSVFDLLLQVMGEGRLTDALGQTVSMTGSVIIMTSNLGSEGPQALGFGGAQASDAARHQAERQHFQSAIEAFFRPEFVGRIDRIVAFHSLAGRTARRLVERALSQAFAREGLQRRNIEVHADDAVIDYLIDVGFDPRYGARPLRQAVEQYITAALADLVSAQAGLRDASLEFRMHDGAPQLSIVDQVAQKRH